MSKPTKDITEETHPKWSGEISGMTTLLLGTFPPPPNCLGSSRTTRHYDFYYPNKNNRLWPSLAKILNYKIRHNNGPEAVQERIQIMKLLNLGVENMGETVLRKGRGAKDADITITKYRNIFGLLEKHETIQSIILTGYSGKTSTYSAFIDYIINHVDSTRVQIETIATKNLRAGQSFSIRIDGRQITCFVVNSTSPLATKRVSSESLIEQLRAAIFEQNVLQKTA
ncbi:hypothetical protein ACES2I_10850 [Bdellovibrio bacteriovorus]|uniref:hypothetical protein n=1 Tax=Bdellovibrio bacteriovorus TaxID=959 RepID=UPI0035A6619F